MIVSIRFNNKDQHVCAGTILTNRYILTVVHCIQNQSSWKITVVSDLYRLSGGSSKTYQVDRIHQHPDYRNQEKKFENDIALLHITKPIDVADVKVSSLTCAPKIKASMDLSQYQWLISFVLVQT